MIVRDHTVLARYSYTLLLLGLLFLALPGVLPAKYSAVNGAQIWIKIPDVFSIQPSEFAKIALIIFTAAFLASKQNLLASAGQEDLRAGPAEGPRPRSAAARPADLSGGAGARQRPRHVAADLRRAADHDLHRDLQGVLADHRPDRVRRRRVRRLPPVRPRPGAGGHLAAPVRRPAEHRLPARAVAVRPRLPAASSAPGSVPAAPTSCRSPRRTSSRRALGEELGLVGLSAILVCYLLIGGRGLRAAIAVKDRFGSLLAGGLSFTLVFQMFIVVGGVTRLIPLTGLTTPFLSYGGSSLLANYIILALLIRISDSSRRPPAPKPVKKVPLLEANTELVPVARTDVVKRPLRRVGIVDHRADRAAAGQHHLHPGGEGFGLPGRPEQPADLAGRATPNRAAPSPRRRARCWPSRWTSNDNFKYQRKYPLGAMYGPVTGYFSSLYGEIGIENIRGHHPVR